MIEQCYKQELAVMAMLTGMACGSHLACMSLLFLINRARWTMQGGHAVSLGVCPGFGVTQPCFLEPEQPQEEQPCFLKKAMTANWALA